MPSRTQKISKFDPKQSRKRPSLSSFFLRRYIASLVILAMITTGVIYWLIQSAQQDAFNISHETTEQFLMNSVRYQVRNYEFESLQESLDAFREALKFKRVEALGPYGKPISSSGEDVAEESADSVLPILSDSGVNYGSIKIWYGQSNTIWAEQSQLAKALRVGVSIALFISIVLGYSLLFLYLLRRNIGDPMNALVQHMNTNRDKLVADREHHPRNSKDYQLELPKHLVEFKETYALGEAYSRLEKMWLEADQAREKALASERHQHSILLEVLKLAKIAVAYFDDAEKITFTGTKIEASLKDLLISTGLDEKQFIADAPKFNLSSMNTIISNKDNNYSLICEFETEGGSKWSLHRAQIDQRPAIILREVTQERDLEQALLRHEKLKAVGTLSSSIAHDFNNVLSTILVNIELIKELAASDEPLPLELFEGIETTVASVSGRIRGIRRLALKNEANLETVDQYERLKELRVFLAPTIGTTLSLNYDLQEKSPVECDANEFESCIINLIVNAKQAIKDDGKITVRSRPINTRDLKQTKLSGQNYVAIDVEDDGPGVPREIADLIFDPFFSTGKLAQSTGLGLAQVQAFCLRAGGAIYLDKTYERGSRFTLLLPKSSEVSETISAAPQRIAPKNNKTKIYILDDNLLLATTTSQLLMRHGFIAIPTDDLDELIGFVDADDEKSILLSDVHMPYITIEDVIEFYQSRKPKISLAFYSGNEESLRQIQSVFNDIPTLLKPFHTEDLLKALEAFNKPPKRLSIGPNQPPDNRSTKYLN